MSQRFKQCRDYDKTPVKSTLIARQNILSLDMRFMSRRNDIML